MSEETKNYGTVTIGFGEPEQKELKVVDIVQATYTDHRLISTCGLEDGSYLVSVENPASTGRSPSEKMRLSEESLIGLMSTIILYFNCKDVDVLQKIKDASGKGAIEYTASENLKLFNQ
jgi:hypothetical protein